MNHFDLVITNRSNSRLPEVLHLKQDFTGVCYRSLLIRLVTGNLKFKSKEGGRAITQDNNYTKLPFQPTQGKTDIFFSSSISEESMKIALSNNRGRNYIFYKETFFELLNFFYFLDRGMHTLAFLHLYRVLEGVCYPLPLIWASRSTDFEGTFNKLKVFFSDDKKSGELKFLELFTNDFMNGTVADCTVSINMSNTNDCGLQHFKALKKAIEPRFLEASDEATLTFVLRYRNIIHLFISCRNKYFHSLTGRGGNYRTSDIYSADIFFGDVNKIFANLLIFLITEVIEHDLAG